MITATLQRYRAAYSGLPREVWLLSIVLFVNRAGTMVLPFMTLYLTSQLGMSEALAGRLIGVYGVGAVCGAYLGGRLAGVLGPIRLQTICMFLSVPGFCLLPVWKSWPAIAASLFSLSVVAEAVRPANATAVTLFTAPEHRTRAFALQRLAANLGFSFGPAVGGVLATIHFGLLFAVDAITTLAAAAALLVFFRMRATTQVASEEEHAAAAGSPLKDGPFVAMLLLLLANMTVFFQFGSTYPLYLRDHFHLTKPAIGLMFAVNTTVIVAFEMLLLDAIKHWSIVRTIGWGCFLSCLGWGILPFGEMAAYAVVAMLVVTMGEMLSFSMAAGFVANRCNRGNESAYMGWYAVMMATASVLGPTLGGEIYSINREAVWYVALVVGVLVLVGFQLLARAMEPSEIANLETVDQDLLGDLAEHATGRPHIAVAEAIDMPVETRVEQPFTTVN
ncbi:MAG TPA: MFS transporter [Lacipirellula sp.]